MANMETALTAELAKARENVAKQEATLFEEIQTLRDELKSPCRSIRKILDTLIVLLLITNPKLLELLGRVLDITK